MEITEESFPEVRSRQEMYLQDIIKSLSNESISDNNYPDPLSRQEAYLQIIISKLRANDPNIEIKTEDIEKAVNKYFEQNPIQLGATENQAKQIEENKKNVASLKAETGSLKEDVANKITKFYANNLGEMHITDSDNGKIQDMQIFGRSEQKKYNGYQLLALAPINLSTGEKASLPYTEKGITVDIANDGIGYTVRGTNTLNEQGFDIYLSMPSAFDIEAGTYTRSGKIINGNSNVELVSGGGTSSGGCLEYRANKVDFTFTETVKKGKSGNFIIRISPSAKVNAIVYFQIEKGSEAHGFEPYVGGQPSPSPDYPQEIKNVVNPTVKVCGKNLWNPILGGYISGIDGSIVAASKKTNRHNRFYKNKWKRYYCYSTQF